MAAFDELLYLHPASVMARIAAEPPKPHREKAEKPKAVTPERRLLLKLVSWGGVRKAAAGQAAS